jgi:hypothetical protein
MKACKVPMLIDLSTGNCVDMTNHRLYEYEWHNCIIRIENTYTNNGWSSDFYGFICRKEYKDLTPTFESYIETIKGYTEDAFYAYTFDRDDLAKYGLDTTFPEEILNFIIDFVTQMEFVRPSQVVQVVKELAKNEPKPKPKVNQRGYVQRAWATMVKHRDGKCRECGSTSKLNAHHIEQYALNEALRYEISNGITLCDTCHRNLHKTIGRKTKTSIIASL